MRASPGGLLALAAAACWGLSAVVAKDLFFALPPVRLAQVRALSASGLLVVGLAVLDRHRLRLPRDAWLRVALFGSCLSAVNGSYYLAIGRLPVGVALSIQYLGPLIVLGVRRRRVTSRLWVAAIFAVAGAALVAGLAGRQARLDGAGLGFAAVSAVGFAGYLLAGEAVGRRLGSVPSVAWGFATATVVWAVVQPWWSFPFGHLAWPGVPWRVAVVCLVGTVAPFLFMVAALRSISAGPAGVLATAEPAFGALFAWLLLSETLSPVQVLGMVLVVAGVAAVQALAPAPAELEVVE